MRIFRGIFAELSRGNSPNSPDQNRFANGISPVYCTAIRLYVIGSQTFGQAVDSAVAMTVVGLATVLSAEVGQVVFSLALATLGTSRSSRRVLYASMSIATILALTGNIQTALPGHAQSPFAWLEAVTPPLIVLSTAYVLKEQVLERIEQRHADERAFQSALAEWQVATAEPEQHSQWSQFYANALRDALLKANSRRKEALSEMTIDDWRVVVYRETQADLWYEVPEHDEETPAVGLIDSDPIRRNGHSAFPKVSAAAASGAV
jgi:hypothetical protein